VELLIYNLAGDTEVPGRVDGVLGQNFLSQFNYLLDYRRSRITFDPVMAGGGAVVPFERIDGRAMIAVEGISTGPWHLVLDTGAAQAVLFRQPGSTRRKGKGFLITDIGSAEVSTSTIPRLEIRGTEVHGVEAAVIPRARGRIEDGLLPARLFRSIYVNNREKYLILNPEGA
jgi:hypothetical protein